MKKKAKKPIEALFVNCVDHLFILLESELDDKKVNYRIIKVTQEEFCELFKNDQIGAFSVIMFHLRLGEDYAEGDLFETDRFFRDVRELFPYIRIGIMSGVYDYECLGGEADTFNSGLNYKINFINEIVLGLKPDFYCSYTEDSFDVFVAEQIAKGWLREEEVTWRDRERTNILTPKVEIGPEIRRERE